jgi:predicted small metal-binding protein
MDGETMTVRCVCGWETTGPEEEVVVATIDHGRRVHNMTATRDEVLAMAIVPPEPKPVQRS